MILNNVTRAKMMNADGGYSNTTGSSTPNLDFLKQSLVDIDKKILDEQNKLTTNTTQRTSWIKEASRLKSLWAKAVTKSKKDGLNAEWANAESKVEYYGSQIGINNSTINSLNSDRLMVVDKIAKYQDAVNQSLSQGNTDAGSQQVAELLIEQEVQSLKNQKYGYLKIGGVILILGIVTFVVVKVIKK